MRLSKNPIIQGTATVYIEFFRGTSLLVQLFWFYYVLPFFGLSLEAFTAGVVAIGMNFGAYGAERENKNATQVDDVQDEFNGSWFVNYNFGPVSIGYQETYFDAGLTHSTNDLTTTEVRTVGESGGIFSGEAMSIAFNVNDNVSISYSEVEDTYDAQANTTTGGDGIDDVAMKTESLQVAYSMGSMSIKAYSTETSNPNYDSDADKLNVNEIALGLAF